MNTLALGLWPHLDSNLVRTDDDRGEILKPIFTILRRQSDGQSLYRFSEDSCLAITTLDGTLWSLAEDFESGPAVAERDLRKCILDMTTGKSVNLPGTARALAWTNDAMLLIASEPRTGLRLWDNARSAWHDSAVATAEVSGIGHDRTQGHAFEIPIGPLVRISPDGRRIAWCQDLGTPNVLNLRTGTMTEFPDVLWTTSSDIEFSVDGRYVISTHFPNDGPERGQFLWDVQTGECLDLIGDDCFVEVCEGESLIPWVTGIRVFRPDIEPTIHDLAEPLFPNGRISGRFDSEITFRCRHCHRWSALPSSVLDTIESIHKTARLTHEDSPVLELPDNAWDCVPALLFECPTCDQQQKSTPFVVDRRSAL